MPRPNKGYRLGNKPNAAGIWEIIWSVDGCTKRRSTSCKNYGDAQKVLANLILLNDRIDTPNIGGLTVSEALGDHKAESGEDYWHEHVKPKVIGKDTQKYAIVKLHQHYGPIAIRDLSPQDTLSYIDKRVEGEIGHPSEHSTIGRELAVLSAAINHMAKHHAQRIGLAPAQQLPVIHKPVANGPRDRWLTEDEASAILTVARGRDKKRLPRVYLFTMLALHTAARSGAIRALTWFQVDLDRKLINLNPRGRAQTAKRRPPIPISDALLPMLIQAKAEAKSSVKKSEYVLKTPGTIRTAFGSVIEDAGLLPRQPWLKAHREPTDAEWSVYWQARVTPHTFRHTWATWAAQRGVPLFEIAGMLGDSMKTVELNYAHHHPDHLRGAVSSMPKIGAL